MAEPIRYLFVYGTLRSDVCADKFRTLGLNPHFVSRAVASGHLYEVGEYSALDADRNAGASVRGEVYEIPEQALERTFAALDEYEGIGPAGDQSTPYRRDVIDVVLADEGRARAWAYVLNRPVEGLRRIESGDFARWLRQRDKESGRRRGVEERG